MWGATLPHSAPPWRPSDFNPRPPCGGRPAPGIASSFSFRFQSTPPVWGATSSSPLMSFMVLFQSTPPVWGATAAVAAVGHLPEAISIHAPRVGGDSKLSMVPNCSPIFQSTPPVWGATCPDAAEVRRPRHFNPRPPCGGRRTWALRPQMPCYFNPRPPCGGRPEHGTSPELLTIISIHAPRVGGDPVTAFFRVWSWLFQSTPPVWGATPGYPEQRRSHLYFNPRPPCGGRHNKDLTEGFLYRISIHAPRVGGDRSTSPPPWARSNFNPRPPCGGRRAPGHSLDVPVQISIHAPRVGGDS